MNSIANRKIINISICQLLYILNNNTIIFSPYYQNHSTISVDECSFKSDHPPIPN